MNMLRLYAITMLFLTLIMLSGCMTMRTNTPRHNVDNPMVDREQYGRN